ncbi:unnamed protein product [Effrenium voratum]|nr:unnamed protein product [Effrenium voratum]
MLAMQIELLKEDFAFQGLLTSYGFLSEPSKRNHSHVACEDARKLQPFQGSFNFFDPPHSRAYPSGVLEDVFLKTWPEAPPPTSSMRLWALAALLASAEACSCAFPRPVRAGKPLLSPAVQLLEKPLVFVGEVLSVQPADQLPEDKSAFCASETCPEDFEYWDRCMRRYLAKVTVNVGIKGIEVGDIFTYNCTKASCGDCSPPCPEAGNTILDGTVLGGHSSICGSNACQMGPHAFGEDDCKRKLSELETSRPHRARVLIPLAPCPKAAKNDYFRSSLLYEMRSDLSDTLQVSEYEFYSLDILDIESHEPTLEVIVHHAGVEEAAAEAARLPDAVQWRRAAPFLERCSQAAW